jgi:hypothetical protein
MRSHGYLVGPAWDGFLGAPRPEQELADARKARENAPAAVFSEMVVVFGTALGVVLLIDIAVLLMSVPVHMFHLG